MSRSFKLVPTLVFMLLGSLPLSGQNPNITRTEKIVSGTLPGRAATMLSDWAALYFAGDWVALQKKMREDLEPLAIDAPDEDKLDWKRRAYSIVFVTTAQKPEGEIIRVVLQPRTPGRFSTTLPGVSKHYELHVKSGAGETLSSTYASTETDNPTATQVAGFVKQFDPKGLGAFFPPFSDDPATATTTFHVDLRAVVIDERAKIDVEDTASTTPSLNSTKLITDTEDVTKSVLIREARNSTCAKHVAEELEKAIKRAVRPATPEASWTTIEKELSDGYSGAVQHSACASASSYSDNLALVAVESKYRDLIKKAGKVTGKSVYANVPYNRVGLGAIAGVITSVPGDHDRYKVADGKLVLDPLTGGLTAAAINIHPFKFNPATKTMTAAESFRFFVGPILTPELGVAGGIGFGILRGLSVNAGYGIVRTNTLRPGDAADAAPTDPRRPLRNSSASVLFFGLGYNFQ